MKIVNMHAAKTTLSRLVEEACSGEDIVLARDGEPLVRLTPVRQKKRRLGRWKGKVRMTADFDAPLADAVLAAFRGEQ